jgi:hypothetical protein
VDHEHAAQDLAGGVEVDAVAVGDVPVVFHVARGYLVVSDEVVVLGLWGLL